MATPTMNNGSRTRQRILRAALKHFARSGYAGASVQRIVDDAGVTKPSLYYYFPSKARLYHALVDHGHDERYRLMQAAAEHGRTSREKLVEAAVALFEYSQKHPALMRLSFAMAFAAPGEVPASLRNIEKGKRNFDFIQTLIEAGLRKGELNPRFEPAELAFGIFSQLNTYIMVRLLHPHCQLDRRTAERMVELFLQGAVAGKPPAKRGAGRNAPRGK